MSTRVWLFLSFLLFLSTLCWTQEQEPVIPPIETFMQIGSCTNPQVSEDGNSIFFTTFMSGVDQVYRLLPSGWPYQLTVFKDGIDFYRISPSGRWIVVGASVGGSEQSNLYLIDSETGSLFTLKQGKDVQHGSPLWSRCEKYVYFRSNEENGRDFYIYRVNISKGVVEPIWKHSGWNSPAFAPPDTTTIIVSHYESNMNNDLYLLNLEDGSERLLTRHDGDYLFIYPRLSPEGDCLYLLTNLNEDGLMRVARMSLEDGKTEFINADSPWETEEMDLSPDGRFLGWVENVEGYGTLYILDLLTGEKTELTELKGIVSNIDFSATGVLVFTFSSASQPPDIWKYRISDSSLVKLTYSTFAGVDPSLFVEPQLIKYKSFDGLKIPAFLYLPPNWQGGPIPFVIHIHGGPESQFRPGFIRHFQYLALNGYGILAPNIRGSSGYGREYVKLDDYKKRKNAVRDVYEAAKWLVDNGYSEFGRIAVKGASYGGYMTLAALVEYPDVFGAGIESVGIANFVTFLKNTKPYRRAIREAEYGPLTDEKFLREISPITHASRIKAPLLIIHGENDPRVPVGEARQIAQKIKARGGVVETLIFPDEGHGVAKLSNRLVLYRRMVEFLDTYIK